jgi:hypothetical protein
LNGKKGCPLTVKRRFRPLPLFVTLGQHLIQGNGGVMVMSYVEIRSSGLDSLFGTPMQTAEASSAVITC